MTIRFSTPTLKRFHRLQWKLTISYLVTSVIVLCLLEMLVVLIGYIAMSFQERETLENRAQTLAHIVSPDLPVSGDSRQQQFRAMWELLQTGDPAFQGYLAAVDEHGQVIVAAGDHAPKAGHDLQPELPASVQQTVREVFSFRRSIRSDVLYTSFEQGSAYVVAPLLGQENIRGALIVRGYHAHFSGRRYIMWSFSLE